MFNVTQCAFVVNILVFFKCWGQRHFETDVSFQNERTTLQTFIKYLIKVLHLFILQKKNSKEGLSKNMNYSDVRI